MFSKVGVTEVVQVLDSESIQKDDAEGSKSAVVIKI